MQNRILNFNDRILDFIGFMFNQLINKSQIYFQIMWCDSFMLKVSSIFDALCYNPHFAH